MPPPRTTYIHEIAPYPPRFLVVICREGETEATEFDDLGQAREFHDWAGTYWSDSFLCQVLKGPKV